MPTATVHAWNDTGWRHDGAHARLIAFDLDNTLAVSKQPMKPDMTVRIEALTEETYDLGRQLAARYGLSVYDAMIVASALLAGADTLYSEDMHDGLLVENCLRIRNPFRTHSVQDTP